MQDLSRKRVLIATGLLALLMLLTRTEHFPISLHLPDASMAVFFLGGVYVCRHWALALLMLLAVAIDYTAIRFAGVSDYCITAAYGCLLVSYGVLWYGGRLCARRGVSRYASFGALCVCASVAFLISNGSFYWLGGYVVHPDLIGNAESAWQWGPEFVGTTLVYGGCILAAHEVWAQLTLARPAHGAV